ncbi:MAG: hypothetical protein UX18_C0027G0007 [Candidatus Azambacteria bacterium GW2011_GWC2_45_7b]|uniref:Uncharacterized protein n=2 Tax=Parcubacteria group TaxID=1794811 RepID=A0A837IIJ1_9BACT|nr:MAG: hypothetical protein UW53_C0002G0005 [Candidatus Giovannonibacteria bacterium GW2011_GWA1_44_25]KKU12233.1 MAG: hypothetical protein UX18_C0027G0007 [Candidatus Azambacteria bacterium GW2011_GWC2_45_7b]KKU28780.1 MAG: hypothetical protein UX43_C0020G0004 [Candidatus Giovannonibacteria bacterium GW2011_GWB1_46_20]
MPPLSFIGNQIKHCCKDEIKKHAVVGEGFVEVEILVKQGGCENGKIKQKSHRNNFAARLEYRY